MARKQAFVESIESFTCSIPGDRNFIVRRGQRLPSDHPAVRQVPNFWVEADVDPEVTRSRVREARAAALRKRQGDE